MTVKAVALQLLITLIAIGAILVLVMAGGQTRTIRPDGQPVAAPAPPTPQPPPGGEVRNIDALNASARAVGCPTLEPGDPLVKLLDVAECLGRVAAASGKKAR